MRLLLTLALLLPALTGLAQTTLTNDGSTLTVEAGAVLYVDGAVVNTAAATLTNAGTVQLTGDLTNAGALTSAGLLRFSGTTNQVFRPGAASIANLTLDNAGAAGQRTLSIPTDLTISGQLVLLNGLLRTAPAGAATPLATLTLPVGASLSGEQAGRYVQGNLRVMRDMSAATGAVDFGNGAALINPAGQSLGTVTVTRTAGLSAAGVSFGQSMAGANKGIDRVWTVGASQAAQPTTAIPATLTVSWTSDDDNGINVSALVQLWRGASAAGPWAPQGAPAGAISRSFTANISQLGAFTVSNASAPLPVQLTRFTTTAQGPDALLAWATATEKDNDRFEVEASADGHRFQRIATVAGYGSTAQPQHYQLVDKNIARYAASSVYYRLRQVDADGMFAYSPVRIVVAPQGNPAVLALYPNPTTDRAAMLSGAQPGAVVTVFDAIGRQVLATTAGGTGAASLVLPAGHAAGVYLVRVDSKFLRLTVDK